MMTMTTRFLSKEHNGPHKPHDSDVVANHSNIKNSSGCQFASMIVANVLHSRTIEIHQSMHIHEADEGGIICTDNVGFFSPEHLEILFFDSSTVSLLGELNSSCLEWSSIVLHFLTCHDHNKKQHKSKAANKLKP